MVARSTRELEWEQCFNDLQTDVFDASGYQAALELPLTTPRDLFRFFSQLFLLDPKGKVYDAKQVQDAFNMTRPK